MSRYICAVLADSPDYVNRFLMYFKLNRNPSFEVIGFTSQKALGDYLSDSMVDILLLSRDFEYKNNKLTKREEEPATGLTLHLANVKRIVFLGEQQDLSSIPGQINCFRSMKEISQDIAEIVSELKSGEDRLSEKPPDIYSLYSMTRSQDPAEFAERLAGAFPEDSHVLYMDLDTFSGLAIRLGAPVISAMSDCVFSYLSDRDLFRDTLTSSIRSRGRISILCAPVCLKDLDEISSLGWSDFLNQTAWIGGFDKIIINISDSCRDMPGIFGISREIYIFDNGQSNEYTQSRAAAFHRYFESRGRTDITERFRKAI